MKAAAIIAGIAKPIQSSSILALILMPVIYRVIENTLFHGHYAASKMADRGGLIVFPMALGSSLLLAILPKSLGTRKRGCWGFAAAILLATAGGLMMPVILPE